MAEQEGRLRADGSTDCTDALQRAATAGGGFNLQAGCYRITRPIVIDLARHGRCSVTGDGTATLLQSGPGPALCFVGTHQGTASPDSVLPGIYAAERSPRVAGIEIVGEHPEADGIELRGCFKPILTGLLVRECRIGVHLTVRNRDVILDHCQIYNGSGPGIFLDAVNLHQINISDCHLSYNRGGAVVVTASEVRNLQISGCDIEYNCDRSAEGLPTADILLESRGGSIREGAITGCTIQSLPSHDGANLRFVGESAEVSHKVGLFSVTGNLISSQQCQIHLRYARGVTITGNTFFSGHRRNVVIEDSSNVVVSGNVFDHNPDYARDTLDGLRAVRSRGLVVAGNLFSRTLQPDGAVDLDSCREVTVSDNQILDPAVVGLGAADCHGVTVSGTTVVDARGVPQMREAMRFARSTECRVLGCRMSPGTAGTIVTEDCHVEQAGNLAGPP